jgi:hypothetical protein
MLLPIIFALPGWLTEKKPLLISNIGGGRHLKFKHTLHDNVDVDGEEETDNNSDTRSNDNTCSALQNTLICLCVCIYICIHAYSLTLKFKNFLSC